MPKYSAKAEWRRKRIMEIVWEAATEGGVTVDDIAIRSAPEGRKRGISGHVIYRTLWVLLRRGLIATAWVPVGSKRGGSRYIVIPGHNAYKVRAKGEPEKPKEDKTPKVPTFSVEIPARPEGLSDEKWEVLKGRLERIRAQAEARKAAQA